MSDGSAGGDGGSAISRAGQALDTLSTIGDARAWPVITRELIDSPDLREVSNDAR